MNYEIEMPQIFTCTMRLKEAQNRTDAAASLSGVKFTVLEKTDNGHLVCETLVTNIEDFKKFNKQYEDLC